MNETTSIIIPDASAIQVDTSCIDVSEVESQEDKDFLQEKGDIILHIVAKAALQVGQQLVEIQEHFRAEDSKGTGLVKYYESLRISHTQATSWANKYRAYVAYCEIFGSEDATTKFNGLGDQAVSQMWSLPADYREAFFADIALGEKPTTRQVAEVANRPEVKLSKAQELLAAARARKEEASDQWELAKADPALKSDSAEYKHANEANWRSNKAVNRYEQRIAELEQLIEEERQAREAESKRVDNARAELDKLKFDDEQTRQERIKRLTNSLTISVPQVMADLQKFFAEKDQYPEDIRAHLLEQSTYLTNYIADQLDAS